MKAVINKESVSCESFHNLCKIATAIGYWNPIGAIKELDLVIEVEKDDCGNIVAVLT